MLFTSMVNVHVMLKGRHYSYVDCRARAGFYLLYSLCPFSLKKFIVIFPLV